jgi:hypothetical protein
MIILGLRDFGTGASASPLSGAGSGVISVTIGDGFKVRLEFVLEQVFKNHSDGGDHDSRAFVARRLLQAAQRGVLSLEKLKGVAQEALHEALQSSKSA